MASTTQGTQTQEVPAVQGVGMRKRSSFREMFMAELASPASAEDSAPAGWKGQDSDFTEPHSPVQIRTSRELEAKESPYWW